MCVADVIEAQRCEAVCPNFHSHLLAELGLDLESLESKADLGAGEQAWVQTLYLRQKRPDQGRDLLPPPRGKSQDLDRSLGLETSARGQARETLHGMGWVQVDGGLLLPGAHRAVWGQGAGSGVSMPGT